MLVSALSSVTRCSTLLQCCDLNAWFSNLVRRMGPDVAERLKRWETLRSIGWQKAYIDAGRLRDQRKLFLEFLLATLATKEEERKMIYGSIESVLTTKSKSIDSWTAWRKAFTFHLIFLQVISNFESWWCGMLCSTITICYGKRKQRAALRHKKAPLLHKPLWWPYFEMWGHVTWYDVHLFILIQF